MHSHFGKHNLVWVHIHISQILQSVNRPGFLLLLRNIIGPQLKLKSLVLNQTKAKCKMSGRCTHGSGECIGEEACLMYWVHWNTLNAKLARKSLAESRPATGRRMKPVRSDGVRAKTEKWTKLYSSLNASMSFLPLRKLDTSSNWGMLSALYPQCLSSRRKASRYSVQAWVVYNSLTVE